MYKIKMHVEKVQYIFQVTLNIFPLKELNHLFNHQLNQNNILAVVYELLFYQQSLA